MARFTRTFLAWTFQSHHAKRQTDREVGTQSQGALLETARLPKLASHDHHPEVSHGILHTPLLS